MASILTLAPIRDPLIPTGFVANVQQALTSFTEIALHVADKELERFYLDIREARDMMGHALI